MIDFLISLGFPKQYLGEFILVLFFLICSLFLLFLFKKKDLPALIFSTYVGFSILQASLIFPLLRNNFLLKTVFLVFVIALSFSILKKLIHFNFSGRSFIIWIKSFFLASSLIIFIFSVFLSWFSQKELNNYFNRFSVKIFKEDELFFFWVILPLFFLFILRKN